MVIMTGMYITMCKFLTHHVFMVLVHAKCWYMAHGFGMKLVTCLCLTQHQTNACQVLA